MIKLSIKKNSITSGKDEFHNKNNYLYLGRTSARIPKSGTYSEVAENPKYLIIVRFTLYGLSIRIRRVSYWVTNDIRHFLTQGCDT